MAWIQLDALDGSTVVVNPDQNASLTPIPAALLPAGVASGTYVGESGAERVAVQGTPVEVAVQLNGGSAIGAPVGAVDPAGLIVAANGITEVTRTGAGTYSIALSREYPLGSLLPMVSLNGAAPGGGCSAEISALDAWTVLTWNAAGALTDRAFTVLGVFVNGPV